MKNIFKIKLNKVFLVIVIFMLSLTSFAYAEDEAPVSIDIFKSNEGWYKNWIMDFGAVRITLRDDTGEILQDNTVFPTQWEGIDTWQRNLNTKGIDNQKDSHGNEVWFLQEKDGIINFKDYVNSDANGEIKYSDNIPQLVKRSPEGSREAYPYIYFEDFSLYETIDSWETYNNGENVNKLANDLGLTSFSEGKVFYEWLKTANAEGITPSLEIQPLSIYPETSEQIYCNDLDTVKAVDIKMQWNSDASAYLAALEKEKGKLGFLGTFIETLRLKILGNKTWFGNTGLLVFHDFGIIEYSDLTFGGVGDSDRKDSSFTAEVETVKDTTYVNLTYTQASKYSYSWVTDGFWANFEKFKEPMAIGYYDLSHIITVTGGKIYDVDDTSTTKEYDNIKVNIDGNSYTLNDAMVLKNVYENRYEIWQEQIYGLGEEAKIYTDHNKYTAIINGTEKLIEKLLNVSNFECTDLPKYGAGLIPLTAQPISQILIKFNANLDQIGGTKSEDLPSEYWLVGRVGSYEYQWYQKYDDGTEGAKIQKFPKTFPDSIADGLGGANHNYTTYGTTKQSAEGGVVGGKRFYVNKTKVLTQEIIDSALGRQEKTDKKNIKQAVLDALTGYSKLYETANAARNALGVDEVVAKTLEGATYNIDAEDSDKWDTAIENY